MPFTGMRSVAGYIGRLVVSISWLKSAAATAHSDSYNTEPPQFMILGVSGTLQDGFPLRDRLDFQLGESDESRAVFIGKGLVRGYKAYLDIKEEGWREYVLEPKKPSTNHVVLPSGCHEHANIYWFYAVDTRQVLSILNNEPRFLGIAPDTGLVDLTSAETSEVLRYFARYENQRQGTTDIASVAIPLVTGVWYHPTFVPSPPAYMMNDGTEVTSFETSLVLWAHAGSKDDLDSHKDQSSHTDDATCAGHDSDELSGPSDNDWELIHRSVRRAENSIPPKQKLLANGPPFHCSETARLGVGPSTARVNKPFTAAELMSILKATKNY